MTRPSLVAAGLAATLVAGLGLVGPAADAATPVGRSALRFHGTKAHSVSAPSSVRPGIVHLRSSGRALVLLVGAKRASVTKSDLVKDLKKNSPQRLFKNFSIVGEAGGKSDSYVRLTRGTYYFVNIEGIKASKIATMTVTGSRVDAKLPDSRKVVITKHHHLTTPYAVPSNTYLHVVNNSGAFTNLLFYGVAKKATYKQLRDLVDHPTLDKFFSFLFEHGHFLSLADAPASPQSASWQHFHGTSGRYVFAMLSYSDHGEPRLHSGQVRIVKVK